MGVENINEAIHYYRGKKKIVQKIFFLYSTLLLTVVKLYIFVTNIFWIVELEDFSMQLNLIQFCINSSHNRRLYRIVRWLERACPISPTNHPHTSL